MYSFIAENILYPLGDLALGTSVIKYYHWLQKTQWWSPEQLKELQNQKLRKLIEHAYNNVPYYRQLFDSLDLSSNDIQTAEDLGKLPILTKEDIRANFDGLKATDFNKHKPILNTTSGSTGEPFKYYITKDIASISWAGVFRGWGWARYKPGDKRVTLAGAALIPNAQPSPKQWLRDKAERNLKLSAFDMNERAMTHYTRRMTAYRPKFLRGYASALYQFASYLESYDINNIRPLAVFSTAEVLFSHQRETIERQFGCKVFDQYGCYDGGPQAMECPEHCGLHISTEKAIMEFVDPNRAPVPPGQQGEIITTDLYNYSMPFIRYAVGDLGTLATDQCSCGRGLPLMKSLQGRIGDFITTPSGKKIHGEFFSHILWETSTVRQFQVVQETRDSLLIKLVPHVKIPKDALDRERQRILDIVRMRTESMNINIEFIDEIPRTKAGKWKFIVSRVSSGDFS